MPQPPLLCEEGNALLTRYCNYEKQYLECYFQTELYVARSTGAEHRVGRVWRVPGETESSSRTGRWVTTGSSEVRMVESIEKLRPEFGPGSLSQMPSL